jgi:hypothetical protein
MSELKLIHQRDVIRNVRDRFLDQYRHYPDDSILVRQRVGDTRQRLAKLDLETCSVQDVDEAIGVTGWAANECDLCRRDFPTLMRIGEEPGYEARWVDICEECLSEAVARFAPLPQGPEE